MSRGHGAAQRFLLERLTAEYQSLWDLAEEYRPGGGRSTWVSLRSASQRLEKEGLLQTEWLRVRRQVARPEDMLRRGVTPVVGAASGNPQPAPCEHAVVLMTKGGTEWWFCREAACRKHDKLVWTDHMAVRAPLSPEELAAEQYAQRVARLRTTARMCRDLAPICKPPSAAKQLAEAARLEQELVDLGEADGQQRLMGF